MSPEEQAAYFAGCHNSFQHYWDQDATCVFCGAFGPVESFDVCMPREEIGRTLEKFINILKGMGILDEVSKRFCAESTPEEGGSEDAPHWPERSLEIRRCDLRFNRDSDLEEEQ